VKLKGFVLAGALLLCASGVYGDGGYQNTIGRRGLVWRDDVNAENAATWSGQRDEDGYATGYGTLTWYRLDQRIVTGSYLPITRKTLISQISGTMVQGKLMETQDASEVRGKTAKTKSTDDRKDGATSSPVRPGDEPEPRDTAVEQSEQADHLKPNAEGIRERAAQGSRVETPAEAPSAEQPNDSAGGQRGPGTAGQTNSDLQSLTGPPSSLRTELAAHPRLSKAEVIRLADEQARAGGYNVADYQGRLVKYNTNDETWSVFYNQKPADGAAKTGKHFAVTVEDKTDKTSIMPGT
jgi:hypothetical protein